MQGSKVMHQSRAGTLTPEEPDELIAHVRVCGGAGWVTTGSTRKSQVVDIVDIIFRSFYEQSCNRVLGCNGKSRAKVPSLFRRPSVTTKFDGMCKKSDPLVTDQERREAVLKGRLQVCMSLKYRELNIPM